MSVKLGRNCWCWKHLTPTLTLTQDKKKKIAKTFLKNVRDVYACVVLRTAGCTTAVDRGDPQVRWAGVKDDFEGLRRSSNGDDAVVSQLELWRHGDYSWAKWAISQSSVQPSVRAFRGNTYISIVGHGLGAHGKAVVKLGHGVVWELEPVLLPQALLLQELSGCFTFLQRHPRFHQWDHLNLISLQLHLYTFNWLMTDWMIFLICPHSKTSHYLHIIRFRFNCEHSKYEEAWHLLI